jgi:hypothetical protein
MLHAGESIIRQRDSLKATIPALMKHGVSSTVDEVKKFSMAVLLDIIKQSGKYIVYV